METPAQVLQQEVVSAQAQVPPQPPSPQPQSSSKPFIIGGALFVVLLVGMLFYLTQGKQSVQPTQALRTSPTSAVVSQNTIPTPTVASDNPFTAQPTPIQSGQNPFSDNTNPFDMAQQ